MTLAVGASVLLVLLAGLVWHSWPSSTPLPPTLAHDPAAGEGLQVLTLSGRVDEISGSTIRRLQPGDRLRIGRELRLAAGASLRCRLPDGSIVSSSGSARWRFADGGHLLEVYSGTLSAEVQPREGWPLRLRSDLAEATVLGTVLHFSVQEDQTRLDVDHGAVRFTHRRRGDSAIVQAGQWCIATVDQDLMVEPVDATAPPTAVAFRAPAIELVRGPSPEPARGERGRPFREELAELSDPVLALPVAGDAVVLDLPVTGPGPWLLWLQWRDEDEDVIAFSLRHRGQIVMAVAGSGAGKRWSWAHARIEGPGPLELVLTPEVDGRSAVDDRSFDHPYRSLVRIGALALTPVEPP